MTAVLSSPYTTVVLIAIVAAGAGLTARAWSRPPRLLRLPPAEPTIRVVSRPFDWWEDVPYLYYDCDPEEIPDAH